MNKEEKKLAEGEFTFNDFHNILFWMSAIAGGITLSIFANKASAPEIMEGLAMAITYSIWLFWVIAEKQVYKSKL